MNLVLGQVCSCGSKRSLERFGTRIEKKDIAQVPKREVQAIEGEEEGKENQRQKLNFFKYDSLTFTLEVLHMKTIKLYLMAIIHPQTPHLFL